MSFWPSSSVALSNLPHILASLHLFPDFGAGICTATAGTARADGPAVTPAGAAVSNWVVASVDIMRTKPAGLTIRASRLELSRSVIGAEPPACPSTTRPALAHSVGEVGWMGHSARSALTRMRSVESRQGEPQ